MCPFRHGGPSRAARWAPVWTLLAKMEKEGQKENLEVIKVNLGECMSERVEPAHCE